jgi:SHS2 domain-containing protein
MGKYEILPHTADGKFRAHGRTLEEAFANAALALASLMWDWRKVAPKTTCVVRVRAADREQLLVRFLGEIIYLLETKRFVLARTDRLRIEERAGRWTLEAVLAGDTLSDRYDLFGDVKAVTYHELKIEEGDGFTLQVVVDM